MSGAGLRPATVADAPRLAELVQAAYGHYVEYDRRRQGEACRVYLRKKLG